MRRNIPVRAIILTASLSAAAIGCSGDDGKNSGTTTTIDPVEAADSYQGDWINQDDAVISCQGTATVLRGKLATSGWTTVDSTETSRCLDGNPDLSREERELDVALRQCRLERWRELLGEPDPVSELPETTTVPVRELCLG